LTITEATITIDADDKTRVYGAADPPFTYVTTGLLPPDTLITPATCSSTATAASPVGGYPITCSGATASANYTITYVGGTLTIGQADQAITVTMPAPASALVNSTFNVAATGGGSGNPVAIAGSGACSGAGNSVAGNQVAITMTSGVGTCVVTYNQAGNANFNAAPQVSSNTTAIDQATVQFAAPTYIDDESQSAQIAISRSGDLSATTTVSFATSVGGANPGVAGTCGTAGADYVAVGPQTVTFLPTETEQFVSIELCRDMLEENLETLNLALSSPSNGVLGAQPTAVLRINDTANQFTSTTPISIGGVVTPYPATINVSGIPAANGGMRVTLYDLTVASPGNIDILLVGPLGQKLIIMGDAGGATAITTPTTLTFEDAAGAVLPQSSLITTGKYEPTTWVPGQPVFAAPAPGGPYFEPGSTVGGAPTQVAFGTANPNGQWRLFVRDDGSSSALFAPLTDQVAGGWGLQFNTLTAAGVSISGRVLNSDGRGITNAVVSVSGNALASPIVGITNRRGIYTIEGLQAGGTYVITVASRRFMFNAATRVITLTDNATDVDFVADPLE
jgi:hypothetical protein